jgi:hypothetical protein
MHHNGNILGELFTLNLLFWVLGIVIFANYTIGLVLGMSGWIFSAVNPRHNYYTGMHLKYKFLIWGIFAIIIGAGIISTYRNIGNYEDKWVILIQFILVFVFLFVLFRLFFLKNAPFNVETVQALWKRIGHALKIKPPFLITFLNLSPFILYLITKSVIQPILLLMGHPQDFGFGLLNPNPGQSIEFYLYMWIGFGLLIYSAIIISLILLRLEDEMRKIAVNAIPIVKPDKLEEHHFHFWEVFAIPIATMFSITMGGLFVMIMQNTYSELQLRSNGLEFFIPVFGQQFIYGAYLGVLIWQGVNGIHYLWHVSAIRKEIVGENPKIALQTFVQNNLDHFQRIKSQFLFIFFSCGLGLLGNLFITQQNLLLALIISLGIFGPVIIIVRNYFRKVFFI